jgi:hypothetical protein
MLYAKVNTALIEGLSLGSKLDKQIVSLLFFN